MRKIILTSLFAFISVSLLIAKENVNNDHRTGGGPGGGGDHTLASCNKSTAQTDLDINNIRTKIFINGDMWWDLVGTATYEVPKGSGKHSLFAGAVWVGGYDNSHNLRVAAQTYRQSGDDFWPGPVNITTTDVTPDVCTKFDRHFRVTRDEVQQAIALWSDANGGYPAGYVPPQVMQDWPGNGDDAEHGAGAGYVHFLAPFFDRNVDGIYDWQDGDYPYFEFNSSAPVCDDRMLGDQSLWWVFNDVGNVHRETDSQFPIGLEIQAQAFAFATNDEINNMSFYKYKIINRNTTTNIDSCYFGAWVDPDLGNYLDDYVGCDVKRGFGYCYNGDANDEGIAGYGFNPPAVGVDFFQGPAADVGDHRDNDRDSCIDCTFIPNAEGGIDTVPDTEVPELIIMSKFVYYNNNNDAIVGNPSGAEDYYGYLKGIWRNNSPMSYGGNGHGGGFGGTTDLCDFMFPGNSDPNHWGTNGLPEADWDEVTAQNIPDDRRFLQSSGPFTLKPGAVNFITTGAVWARATNGGPLASVRLVRQADDYAQALFNNCFKVVDGPDAPEMTIRELDKEIILSIDNSKLSNNYKEQYSEVDPNTTVASYYNFQGYQIFQTVDPFVSVNDVHNPDKARLVVQCDVKDGVSQIVNNYFDQVTQGWTPLEEVNGGDNGLKHTFRVTNDLFATGDPTMVNHKTYYFLSVAYAYNAGESASDPYSPTGRNQPYKSGRKNIKIYTAIPHITDPEAYGTELSASYGDGPEITRIEGTGNGHQLGGDRLALDLKRNSDYNKLFSAPFMIDHPTYERAKGPVDIRIYDPVAIQGGDFEIRMVAHLDSVTDPKGHDVVRDTFITTVPANYLDTSYFYDYNNPILDSAGIVNDTIAMNLDTTGLIITFPNDTVYLVDTTYTIDTLVVYDTTYNDTGFATSQHIDSTTNYVITDTLWVLKNTTTGVIDTSLKTLSSPYDQLFPNYGFSINMAQTPKTAREPGDDATGGAGFINSSISYDSPTQRWWGGVNDFDADPNLNWIRSGKEDATDYKFLSGEFDGQQVYEKIINGSWAPYRFTSYDISTNGPANNANSFGQNRFYNQASVDVVITTDKSKWSRCPVVEESYSDTLAVSLNPGTARRMKLRQSLSLDINGNTIVGDTGWSFFPGYAVNLETGERLQMAFGENSYYGPQHGYSSGTGSDMKWNPNTLVTDTDRYGRYILGGRHVIYVFAHTSAMGIYNGTKALGDSITKTTATNKTWGSCMWVGYPALASGEALPDFYGTGGGYSNDVTIRIRVAKPYSKYNPNPVALNDSFPYYKFSTNDLVPLSNNVEKAKTALDLINVVPNPYYAYSAYEKNQLDYRVKIVNLPPKCTVTIFTPSGTLIRKYKRDVAGDNTAGGIFDPKADLNLESSIDWDLKNSAGIPVASGLYIIHVEAPNVGEKTIKFFGVLRPIDLDTF
ncbi:MAG: hypothetical protein ABI763_02045 [Bacteroidota bacterium]